MSERPTPAPRSSRLGLAVMLALVLSVAILPLGLISVYQTYNVLDERRALSGLALLEKTQQAAAGGREIIGAAISSAETLAALMPVVQRSDGTCRQVMDRLVEASNLSVFAGFVDGDGVLVCASTDDRTTPGETSSILSDSNRLTRKVEMRSLEFLGGVATVTVSVPAFDGGRFAGTVWIAVPVTALNTALTTAAPELDLALFQDQGEIVATESFAEDRRSVLPENRTLEELAARERDTFRDTNRKGEIRDFAVVPIVEGRVFAMGSWPPQHLGGLVMPIYEEAMALYFPLLMWIITIGVAYIGVHRLVIRHVRRLRTWMHLYASGRGDLENARLDNAPEELEVVAESFRAMTRRLSELDRHREEDLQEKRVLLREIHHRVKNNLQLISSMMNMQMRATNSPEAKRLLHRVRDRVMALSAIHRYLYLARKLSRVRADELLDEIIQQLVVVGTVDELGHRINVTTELEPIEISPDQSVPLSLLATEAATNAVKHCGASGDGTAWLNIALTAPDDATMCLSVVNSRAPNYEAAHDDAAQQEERSDGSGLGSRLIQSFAEQLNGTLETETLPNRYELHVVFPRAWHDYSPDTD